ncbi:alpha-2-macroglobulin family protein [Thalassotalea crassostreae]|uniref:alpha-2-macroglobulin family protein n=1 Tax=Thalassotalea crassostreae TaxID=1763536 RepID=UPI00083854D2|nr:MG2 domain-containing protein [Thalassotalea crassostreae]
MKRFVSLTSSVAINIALAVILSVQMFTAVASEVSYVGTYSHENKPALIVQFSEKSASTAGVKVIDVITKEDLSSGWFLNSNKLAMINTNVSAGKRYEVTVTGAKKITVASKQEIFIPEYAPTLTVLSKGPVIPSASYRTIPISVSNLDTVSVEVLQVLEPEKILNKLYYNQQIRAYRMADNAKYLKSITTLSFDIPKAEKNASIKTALQLPKELTDGWYVLGIKGGGQMNNNDTKIVQALITDIGIQAKVFADSISVNVLTLSSQQPINKGTVYVVKQDGSKIKLGKLTNGLGNFKYKTNSSDLLMVKAGKRFGYLPLKEVPLDLSAFAVTGNNWQEMEAFAYSNRDLFKPGETLPLNILLRDDDGQSVAKQRLYVEFVQPDGRIVSSRWLDETTIETASQNSNEANPKMPTAGYYRTDYQISSSAVLGKWTAQIKPNKNSKLILNSFAFNVSEFVPERMDLVVDLESEQLISKATLGAKVNGRYLFGAAANGNTLKISPYYHSVNHFEGKYSDYFVGQRFTVYSRDLPNIKPIKLDANGNANLTLPLINDDKLKAPVNASFNFELLETGGASVSRKHDVFIWRDQTIAGINPLFEQAKYFQTVQFDLALIAADGKSLLPGTLDYTLERNRGGYYWTYSESGGWDLHRDNEWRPVSIKSVNLKAGQSERVSMDVEYGNYRLIATNEDGFKTIYNFNAGWGNNSYTQQPVKPDELTLKFDKPLYNSGDTINATVIGDLSGSLLVTLESSEVNWQQTFEYTKSSAKQESKSGSNKELAIQIPIDKDLNRHDLYVTATLVGNERGMPRRMFAVKPVKLNRENRKLDVSISHECELRPLTKTKFVINTNALKNLSTSISTSSPQHSQSQAWLTLSVVDKGIINLSGYQVPDINEHFFGQRRYAGDVVDLYSRIYQQRPDSFLTHRYGGDAAAMANQKPDNLVESKTITLMSELVAFDAQGNAEVTLELPDYNGEAQVVATVFTEQQFGQQTKDVKISSPIVAELAVPRFLTPGDNSQVMLEVFNNSGKSQTITAAVSTTDTLVLDGETKINTKLADGERASVAVPFNVLNVDDHAKVSINIAADDFSQTRSWTIPVRSPLPILTKKSSHTIAPGERFAINQQYWNGLSPIKRDMGELSFSPVPFLDPLEYATGLFRYPYGCAEQTTSKAMPWLIDSPILDKVKEEAADKSGQRYRYYDLSIKNKSAEQMLEAAVMRLTKMQKANGGFGLWNKYGKEEPWLSVYVTDFLFQTAQKYPNIVPTKMLSSAMTRISSYKATEGSSALYYAAWVLAKANKISYAQLEQIEITPLNSSLSAAHIAGAALLLGDVNKAEYYFDNIKRYQREKYNYWVGDYGSLVRDYAKTVAIISELEQQMKLPTNITRLRNELVAKLQDTLPKRYYLSTQEQTALVTAGIALSKGNDKAFTLDIDSQTQNYQGLSDTKISIGTVIENTNAHELFIQIRAKGYNNNNRYLRSTIPTKTFTKSIKTHDGKTYDGEPVPVGEKLIVSVVIDVEEKLDNAMLVDFIPSGFVIENPDFTDANDILASNKLTNTTANHVEYRNDRFIASADIRRYGSYQFHYVIRAETPGQAIMPKGYIEDMYNPERFAFAPAPVKAIEIIIEKPEESMLGTLKNMFSDDE